MASSALKAPERTKMQERGTAFSPQKPSPRSILGQSFSPGTLVIDLALNLRDKTTLSVPQSCRTKDVARRENFQTGNCLGDNQFHSDYSVLCHPKNTQFCLTDLIYKRVWKTEVNPRTHPSESTPEEGMKERSLAKDGKYLILS